MNDYVSVDTLLRLNKRFSLRLAIPVTAIVLLSLAGIRLVWKTPNSLILVNAAAFLLFSALFWWFQPRFREWRLLAGVYRQVGALLSGWLLLMGLLFGSVYSVDRAGWLWFLVTGYNTEIAEELSGMVDLSTAEFVEQNGFFSIDPQDRSSLILTKGIYELNRTVVVPKGTSLTIEPGTVIRFGAGRSLISYSPIIARGTASDPIRFTAHNEWLKWGAVGIVAAGPSVFENVRFEHGRQALVNGVVFNGALSVIDAHVEIKNSHFVDLFGKDGVNVQNGHVLIEDNVFRNLFKDGLDLDGGSGRVSGNRFVNCGDEGIDLSQNAGLEVVQNTVLDRRGGRIDADHNLDEILSQNTVGNLDDRGSVQP